MTPALLGAQVTSTSTSMPVHRVGFQGWAGLLSTDGKGHNRIEKTFICLQTTAIPIQSLASASPKSFWFLPSLHFTGTGTEQDDTGDRPVAPVEPLAFTLLFAGASKWCLGYMPCPRVESSSVCPQGAVLGGSLA